MISKDNEPIDILKNNITIDKQDISRLCKNYHISQLSVFGSALRDDFNDDSDIDILLEFEPNHIPGFFGLFDIEQALSNLLDGRKVDVRTPQDLSRHFRDKVIANAEVQYVLG